ncbi:MAG TPA: glycosyltransferase family 39 protein [Terriglobales bacterium]
MTHRFRIPDWILLLACCVFFFFWQLSAFGLIGADEPRYAQVAREMLQRRDWVTPTLSGTAWLEKPPLYYWQAEVAYKIFGVSDWAARVPSTIDATVMAFAVYWFLRRFRPGFALDAALALTSCAAIVGFARAASTDMPLAATFTIAMIAWFAWFEDGSRTFLAGFYVFVGLATLAKGPVAPFLAMAIVGMFAATQRSWRVIWKSLWLPGILIGCMVALPWYVLVQIRHPQFLRVFILEHNLARFGTNVFHHPEPFWYYVPVTLLGWLPWTVFVIASLVWAVRKLRQRDVDALNVFLFIWIVVVVVFFSVSKSKLPGYILPAIPPGILVLANYLRERIMSRPHTAVVILHAVSTGSIVFAALLLRYTLLQHRFAWNAAITAPLMASVVIAVVIAVFLFKAGFAGLRMATLVPAVVALAVAIRFGAQPLNDQLSARAVSDALAQVSRRNLPVAAVLVSRELEYGLQFYRNQPIPRYELGQAPASEHLVVARAGFQKAFARDVPGRKVVTLGEFPEQKVEFFYVSAR